MHQLVEKIWQHKLTDIEKSIFYFFIAWIVIFLAILFLIAPASAIINVTPFYTSNSSIGWNWSSSSNVINISLDGVMIQNFDNKSTKFYANNLIPNTQHQIGVYSAIDVGSNVTNTLPLNEDSGEQINDLIYQWIFVIFGLVFCIVGLKVPYVGFGATVFGYMGIELFTFGNMFYLFMYAILFVAGLFVGVTGGADL